MVDLSDENIAFRDTLLLEYSMKSRGEDDLRGMIKVFSEIIGMSYENLIDEIKWINKYEND